MLAHKPRQLWLRIPTSQPSIWYEYLSPSCIFMVENGHLYRVTDKLTMRRLSAYIDSREEA